MRSTAITGSLVCFALLIAGGLCLSLLAGCPDTRSAPLPPVASVPIPPPEQPPADEPKAEETDEDWDPNVVTDDMRKEFREDMWDHIHTYLAREPGSSEEHKARIEAMLAEIERAKRHAMEHAAARVDDATPYIASWRKQLKEEETKIWEEAGLLGDGESAD